MDPKTSEKKESSLSIVPDDKSTTSSQPSININNQSNEKNDVNTESYNQTPLEDKRLGGKNPFLTLLIFISGPFFAQIAQASYGLMNTFWMSRSSYPDVTVAISVAYPIGFFITAFAQFFNVMMSDQISYLFGRKEKSECAQVVVDIIRFSLIAGVILPIIMCPCLKPLMRWYGGDSQNQTDFLYYMLPQFLGSFITFVYFSVCGLLQAMGNTFIYAGCQILSCLMNALVFVPLIVKVFKTSGWGASVGNLISNLIPCLALFICLFTKRFIVQPEMKMFIKPFNKHSFRAIQVSIGQLFSQLANSIPMLLMTEMIEEAGERISLYNSVLKSWNVVVRSWGLMISICNGMNQGYLPPASFAYASSKFRRLWQLSLIVICLGTGITLIIAIIIECLPKNYAKLWNKELEYVDNTKKMIILTFATVYLNQIITTTTVMLQAVKKAIASIICALLTMILPLPIACFILYKTKKNDPVRLMYSFIIHDLFSLIVVIIIIVWQLRFIFKEEKTEDKDVTTQDNQLQQEILLD
ncbi:hypothetical protein M9Y10_023434 [Tritrichomonas musculus]|uniref:MatE family protein n=1 Tax=Tritrichomonas musculus TaxID=1915356 RepID=A0ABR2KX02_9EUKA